MTDRYLGEDLMNATAHQVVEQTDDLRFRTVSEPMPRGCTNCGHDMGFALRVAPTAYRCSRCDGYVGTIPVELSPELYARRWADADDLHDLRWVDLLVARPETDRHYRFHGWIDRETGRIVQTG